MLNLVANKTLLVLRDTGDELDEQGVPVASARETVEVVRGNLFEMKASVEGDASNRVFADARALLPSFTTATVGDLLAEQTWGPTATLWRIVKMTRHCAPFPQQLGHYSCDLVRVEE